VGKRTTPFFLFIYSANLFPFMLFFTLPSNNKRAEKKEKKKSFSLQPASLAKIKVGLKGCSQQTQREREREKKMCFFLICVFLCFNIQQNKHKCERSGIELAVHKRITFGLDFFQFFY